MNSNIAFFSQQEIRRRIAGCNTAKPDSPYPPDLLSKRFRPAAVLIPFLWIDSTWHLLFIHRTTNEADPHSGQVAFPGGGSRSGEEIPQETALREAQEELGIQPEHVRVLGQLNDYITITSYRVTPVIGVIDWPYPLSLYKKEVSRSFTIPLNWLADPKNYEERNRPLPAPFQPISVIYYGPYDGEILWGASARITQGLIKCLSKADYQSPKVVR
jgi:8-oxo-dGTP pyrophosphatase MutT (NUDIX family)